MAAKPGGSIGPLLVPVICQGAYAARESPAIAGSPGSLKVMSGKATTDWRANSETPSRPIAGSVRAGSIQTTSWMQAATAAGSPEFQAAT